MGNPCCGSTAPHASPHDYELSSQPSQQSQRHAPIPTSTHPHPHPQFTGLQGTRALDRRSTGPDNFNDETLGDSSGSVGSGVPKLRLRIPEREINPVLAYDRTPPADESVLLFLRSTNDLSSLPDSLNKTGMQALLLSGSEGISSKKQVERIVQTAGTEVLCFVDLREESHAIANGYPVTLRGPRDWANVGLSHDEVLQSEEGLIAKLRKQNEVTLYKSLDLRKGVAQPRSVTLRHPDVMSERALVEDAGARYFRLMVTDHSRPRREEVDRFVKLVRDMPEGAAIHVHCLGGRGRTTTFMTLCDMLHNARHVSARDIIERQARFSYDYQMSTINPDKPYKMSLQEDRLEFLHTFHDYARNNPGGKGLLWSEWRRTGTQP
jgi:protein-tyrosine phosphatase